MKKKSKIYLTAFHSKEYSFPAFPMQEGNFPPSS